MLTEVEKVMVIGIRGFEVAGGRSASVAMKTWYICFFMWLGRLLTKRHNLGKMWVVEKCIGCDEDIIHMLLSLCQVIVGLQQRPWQEGVAAPSHGFLGEDTRCGFNWLYLPMAFMKAFLAGHFFVKSEFLWCENPRHKI
jgi:hypothetical protein